MTRARYLVDKSALARMTSMAVAARLTPILETGEAATCSLTDLEVLYSARNADDHRRIRRRRRLAYRHVEMTEAAFQRSIEVQGQMAIRGHHRVPIPDLLIAAAAEEHGLTVLHYDKDFDLIADVTGQPMEWVAERGSVG